MGLLSPIFGPVVKLFDRLFSMLAWSDPVGQRPPKRWVSCFSVSDQRRSPRLSKATSPSRAGPVRCAGVGACAQCAGFRRVLRRWAAHPIAAGPPTAGTLILPTEWARAEPLLQRAHVALRPRSCKPRLLATIGVDRQPNGGQTEANAGTDSQQDPFTGCFGRLRAVRTTGAAILFP